MKLGFKLISIVLLIQGLLGLIGFKVWIRNRGYSEITSLESIFFISSAIIVYMISKKIKE
jgi:hypothetical protein